MSHPVYEIFSFWKVVWNQFLQCYWLPAAWMYRASAWYRSQQHNSGLGHFLSTLTAQWHAIWLWIKKTFIVSEFLVELWLDCKWRKRKWQLIRIRSKWQMKTKCKKEEWLYGVTKVWPVNLAKLNNSNEKLS